MIQKCYLFQIMEDYESIKNEKDINILRKNIKKLAIKIYDQGKKLRYSTYKTFPSNRYTIC